MSSPQSNSVVPPKSPQVLAQELDKQIKEVEENLKQQQAAFEKNQSELEAAQAQWQIAQIDAEIASAALDKERCIEKASAPLAVAEKARADAQKKFDGMKREDPEKIATLEQERNKQDKARQELRTPLDAAETALKKAEATFNEAKKEKETAEKAFNEVNQLLDKAEAELKGAREAQAKLTLDERTNAQVARRAWMDAEDEHKKALARFNAEKFEAEKDYARLASDARKRQLAILTALTGKPRPAPAAG